MASTPAYQVASMESVRPDDREQFDQAANALMASLRQSMALNIELREALLQKQAELTDRSEANEERGARAFKILRDIVGGVSRP